MNPFLTWHFHQLIKRNVKRVLWNNAINVKRKTKVKRNLSIENSPHKPDYIFIIPPKKVQRFLTIDHLGLAVRIIEVRPWRKNETTFSNDMTAALILSPVNSPSISPLLQANYRFSSIFTQLPILWNLYLWPANLNSQSYISVSNQVYVCPFYRCCTTLNFMRPWLIIETTLHHHV